MARPEQPTLFDVARKAGVSTATISRALNEPGKIAWATLERIETAIEELGYVPNFGGRLLASSRVDIVGAIIPTMANAMFASGLQAFQEVMAEAGVTMLVATTGYDAENEMHHIRRLISHGAGGLLLIGNERPAATRDFLMMRAVPYVVTWCFEDDPNQQFVGFNNHEAAKQATEHVLAEGHRRIAMISGRSARNDRARNRIAGVRAAIRSHGHGAELIQIYEADYLLAAGGTGLMEIMSAPEPPTAIICGNDVLAAGAICEARARGVKVPDDVSIIGFDDIGLAAVTVPAMSTVRVPQIDMGRQAAQALLRRIREGGPADSIELATRFVRRQSLGPPPHPQPPRPAKD
ncbi:MAG: LacI family DNA-binding transcriptional regulator [Pseudomonadota bacterium]